MQPTNLHNHADHITAGWTLSTIYGCFVLDNNHLIDLDGDSIFKAARPVVSWPAASSLNKLTGWLAGRRVISLTCDGGISEDEANVALEYTHADGRTAVYCLDTAAEANDWFGLGQTDDQPQTSRTLQKFGRALKDFYAEWGEQLIIMSDRSRPFAERLAAKKWVDDQLGLAHKPDDLEKDTDEYLKEFGE